MLPPTGSGVDVAAAAAVAATDVAAADVDVVVDAADVAVDIFPQMSLWLLLLVLLLMQLSVSDAAFLAEQHRVCGFGIGYL